MYSINIKQQTSPLLTIILLLLFYYRLLTSYHSNIYKTTFSSTKTKKNIKKVSIKIVLYENVIN